MIRSFVKSTVVLLYSVFLVSCSSANNKPVLINFSDDSTKIIFSDIQPAGLLQIRNTPGIDTAYKGILSVLQTPSDDDSLSMEKPVPGKVEITDTSIVFVPLKPFTRGNSYLILSFMNPKSVSPTTVLSGHSNYRVEPQQVVLKR